MRFRIFFVERMRNTIYCKTNRTAHAVRGKFSVSWQFIWSVYFNPLTATDVYIRYDHENLLAYHYRQDSPLFRGFQGKRTHVSWSTLNFELESTLWLPVGVRFDCDKTSPFSSTHSFFFVENSSIIGNGLAFKGLRAEMFAYLLRIFKHKKSLRKFMPFNMFYLVERYIVIVSLLRRNLWIILTTAESYLICQKKLFFVDDITNRVPCWSRRNF